MDNIRCIFFVIINCLFIMKKFEMNLIINEKINNEYVLYLYEYDLCRINNLSISIDFYPL